MQSLINFFYRYPKAKLKHFERFGGYFNYCKMMAARRRMEQASLKLPPVISASDGLPIYFLTGKNYLYQTLFCIYSLILVANVEFRFILVDDGSFNEELIARIKKQLPGADIVTKENIAQNLRKVIPAEQYPCLHHKRSVYPHIKKLTDIHSLPHDGWKLVLDSDMLFWNTPVELIDWLKNPTTPIHMIDCEESYGYSMSLMEDISGKSIQPLINVGVIGLNSNDISWYDVENWIKALEAKEGTSYYLEQALTAMLIRNRCSTVLEASNYIVNPNTNAIKNQQGILHHYVDISKDGYYKTSWENINH